MPTELIIKSQVTQSKLTLTISPLLTQCACEKTVSTMQCVLRRTLQKAKGKFQCIYNLHIICILSEVQLNNFQ